MSNFTKATLTGFSMGKEAKLILEQNNDELAGYLEAFLEDFQKIATDMLAAINVDRGATLKIPDSEYNRLKRLSEGLDALAKRKFTFDNVPNFQPVVDALGRVQKSIDGFKFPEKVSVDMPPMERNIATPEIDLKPVTQSIEKLEQLFLSGLGVRITNFDEMPLVFDKVTGSTGGGVSSEVTVTASALPTGAATNAKLDEVITAINAIPGGGGVQYTEGDVDSSITGTAILWEDTSDTLRAVSAAKPLPVDIKNASVAVTGTFWQDTQPVSIAGTVTVDTELPTAEALADNTANPTVPAVGAFAMHYDGSAWDRTLGVNGHQMAAAGVLIGSGSVTSATTIFSLDMQGYNSIVVQVTSAGTTCTITYEGSNDNTIWLSIPMYDMTSTTAATSSTSTAVGLRGCSAPFRYFRARVSTYGSGTVAATYHASAQTFLSPALPVNLAGQTLPTVTTVSTVTNITNQGHLADNAAFTDGTTRLMMAGYIFDETAGTALTENDAAAARVDSKRAQVMVIEDVSTRGTTNRLAITTRLSAYVEGPTAADAAIAANPMTVGGRASDTVPSAMSAGGDVVNAWFGLRGEQITSLEPKAFGGLSLFRTIDLDETEEDVKTSAGTLYGYFIFNAAATTRYVKFYNATAANVTVGTTTPVMTIPIPAGAAANVEFSNGIGFSTAICIAATTGVADADTGAPAANDVVMNVFYK